MKFSLIILAFTFAAMVNGGPLSNRVVSNDDNAEIVPYQAQILNRGFTLCGAVIMSNTRALTAAHCVRGRQTYDLIVQQSVTEFRVDSIIIHPNFDGQTLYSDIAMLIIKKTSNSSFENINLGLPDPEQYFTDIATFIGYGTTSVMDRIPTGKQKRAKLSIKSETKCRFFYTEKFLQKNTICAGGDDYGLCWADAGSGLTQYDEEKKQDILIGIGSFGFECGSNDFPSVFTSTKDHLDWINSNL